MVKMITDTKLYKVKFLTHASYFRFKLTRASR